MCFSASASFAAAIPLILGGAYCIHKAIQTDRKYLAMAVMPIIVGIQQLAEGVVWVEVGHGHSAQAYFAALFYMFFVWIFWPTWVPFMTAMLEPDTRRKKIQLNFSKIGLTFGLALFLPHLIYPEWLNPNSIQNCMSYDTIVLMDYLVPRWVTTMVYLAIIAIPPLISSHFYMRRFGIMLTAFVPITYLFFVHAYLSVLCFFAAIVTIDLIYIIAKDKCRARADSLEQIAERVVYAQRHEAS